MRQILQNALIILVLLAISVISIFAQDPTLPPSGTEDTLARLASDTSKITNGVKPEVVIYEETNKAIRYSIKDPFVEGEKWLPKSTVAALRTYYLLSEIQNDRINKGQMLYLKPEVMKLLQKLENNWSRRQIKAHRIQAILEIESSYVNALQKIHFQVIQYAKSARKDLTFPYLQGVSFVKIVFAVTILKTSDQRHIWLVGETDFRIAKRNDVEPPWQEYPEGQPAQLAGTYRYKIEWNNGQQETATAPFKIGQSGSLTLP